MNVNILRKHANTSSHCIHSINLSLSRSVCVIYVYVIVVAVVFVSVADCFTSKSGRLMCYARSKAVN